MNAKNENEQIHISFSKDEAIVLLEWLCSFNEADHSILFNDQAEERILFDLEAELEKVLSETFQNNYKELILKARERVRDTE